MTGRGEKGGDPTGSVLVVAATEAELDEIRAALQDVRFESVLGRSLQIGRVGVVRVGAVAAGIGKVNAAMVTALSLERLPVELTVSVGVGGGFAAAGGDTGQLAVATGEHYGDEGVETPHGWEGLEAIGIPLQVVERRPYFNALPVHREHSARLLACARSIASVRSGPFVTVSTVTGTSNRAEHLYKIFHALCENMEGAAVAHACLARDVPFVEVRGLSNLVGPRRRETWDLSGAARIAQRAVLNFLREWSLEAAPVGHGSKTDFGNGRRERTP